MNEAMIMAAGLAILSVASGMLGLGVAFAAVPFLGLFLHDLVHEVQPLSLVLNGVTALFSLLGFAQSGLVMWKPAIVLAIVTTLTAPLGGYLAQIVNPNYLWALYFVAVAYLAYRMFLPQKPVSEPAPSVATGGRHRRSPCWKSVFPGRARWWRSQRSARTKPRRR
jgi:hypothetical protein